MKRGLLLLALLLCVVLFSGLVKESATEDNTRSTRKNCTGYVVIEAGKGVNCNGDTIKLQKKHGFYEIASNTR